MKIKKKEQFSDFFTIDALETKLEKMLSAALRT